MIVAPIKWIENWLTDRLQKIIVNGESSFYGGVSSGVPEGSVPGQNFTHCVYYSWGSEL